MSERSLDLAVVGSGIPRRNSVRTRCSSARLSRGPTRLAPRRPHRSDPERALDRADSDRPPPSPESPLRSGSGNATFPIIATLRRDVDEPWLTPRAAFRDEPSCQRPGGPALLRASGHPRAIDVIRLALDHVLAAYGGPDARGRSRNRHQTGSLPMSWAKSRSTRPDPGDLPQCRAAAAAHCSSRGWSPMQRGQIALLKASGVIPTSRRPALPDVCADAVGPRSCRRARGRAGEQLPGTGARPAFTYEYCFATYRSCRSGCPFR